MNRKVLSPFSISSAKCGQGARAACPAFSSPTKAEAPNTVALAPANDLAWAGTVSPSGPREWLVNGRTMNLPFNGLHWQVRSHLIRWTVAENFCLAAANSAKATVLGEPPVPSFWRLLNATLNLPRLLCGALLLAVTPCLSAAEIVRVQPPDTGAALVNPGMGWTLHFYSNFIENYGSKLEPSDTLNDWPGLSTIYLRVPWSYLEPKEGEYNWSLPDLAPQPSKP